MANAFVPHIVAIGSVNYLVKLPDEYRDIEGIVGISIPADPAAKALAAKSHVSTLVESGELIKIRCGLGAASAKGRKLKYHYIVCPIDKLAAAIAALEGKNLTNGTSPIPGGSIQTVGFKTKRNRS